MTTTAVRNPVSSTHPPPKTNPTATKSYRIPTSIQLIFPILVITFLYWVPESPRWLLRRSKPIQCSNALRLLHANDKSYTPDADVQTLQFSLAVEAAQTAESSWWDLVRDPVERRKVLYSAGALVAQQINGIQWFYYFGTVFSQAIGLDDPFLMTIIVFLIQIVTVFVAVLVAHRIPRRPLLLGTTIIMMVSIFVVGCLGIPNGGQNVSRAAGKVIITFVIVEITAFNFAWGPLGWTIVSIAFCSSPLAACLFTTDFPSPRPPKWPSAVTATKFTP